jgi:hypothetical protein
MPNWWTIAIVGIGFVEGYNMMRGWQRPEPNRSLGYLREDYDLGDLAFDPLNMAPDRNSKRFIDLQNKELQNGRLAMLAVAGFAAQELIDGRQILQHIYEVGLFNRA